MKVIIGSLLLAASAEHAFAAWASGGGQIHRDGQNPWFLENTEVVHYCVDVDAANFGVTQAEASAQVKSALDDWKAVFRKAKDESYYSSGELVPYGQLRIATQRFEEHGCADSFDLDLRFQLGRLTANQEAVFANPKEYVGIAVRTDYNKEMLKGKGFIYLSPSSGPLAPNHPRMHPDAWRERQNLAFKFVLRHELGHVFGFEHSPESVMDDKLPEIFVDKVFLIEVTDAGLRSNEKKISLAHLFGQTENSLLEECGNWNPVTSPHMFNRKYSPQACGRIARDANQITIEYKVRPSAEYETIGNITLSPTYSTEATAAISLFLPAEQRVFSKIPDEALVFNRLYGAKKITSESRTGFLSIEATGEQLPIQMEWNMLGNQSTVFKDGAFKTDFIDLP